MRKLYSMILTYIFKVKIWNSILRTVIATARMRIDDVHTRCYSLSNDTFINVVFRGLDIHFQGENFQWSLSYSCRFLFTCMAPAVELLLFEQLGQRIVETVIDSRKIPQILNLFSRTIQVFLCFAQPCFVFQLFQMHWKRNIFKSLGNVFICLCSWLLSKVRSEVCRRIT